MNRLISILVSGVLLAMAVPVAAQEVAAQAPPDLASLEALCETNAADAAEEGLCLYVVHSTILPGTGPASDEYGLGDAQYHEGMRITPLKVEWNIKPTATTSTPGKGKEFVAVLMEYTAGEDHDSYLALHWGASDREGASYDQPTIGREPGLDEGQIRPHETVRGWVTFEVPRKTRWLRIRHEMSYRDTLYWTLGDTKGQ